MAGEPTRRGPPAGTDAGSQGEVVFRFEKLAAWQLAIEFCDAVYAATRGFPADERFGITSQLRRAVGSIPANIAEGCGRSSDRDNRRFVEIAYGSLMEVVSFLVIARRQEMLAEEDHQALRHRADRLARVLSGLRDSLSPQ